MGGQVNFTGLNTGFDSGALIQQLVDLEIQSRVNPLEQKKAELQQESGFLNSLSSSVSNVQGILNFDAVIKGNESLSPKLVSSSDTDNEFLSMTTTDLAVAQDFDIEILQLATKTIRKSSSNLSLGINTSTQLTDLNLKGFSDIVSGSVTIGNETLDYTEAAKTVLKSANSLTEPADIDEDTILNNANFNGGVTLSNGTLTINGDERTFALDPSTSTVQDMLDFLETFSGVTEATLVNGRVKITGANSIDAGTSNIKDALDLDEDDINGNVLTGGHNITEHTLADWGMTGTDLTINGVTINFAEDIENDPPELSFDPNVETMASLVSAINKTSSSDTEDALDIKAAYTTVDDNDDEFLAFNLTNNIASTDPIVVTSSDSNIISAFELTDETLGTDNSLANVLTFLETFSTVTSASLVDGKIEVQGSFESLGSPGDDSNMLSALGLRNAKIDANTVTGIQNLDAPESSTTLEDLGVTGTTLTINGEDISYEATDSIQDLINTINNTANTKISAFYDGLNGDIVFTNEDTGALALTVSSDGNLNSILNLDTGSSQTLGKNAEFTISTVNNGGTLVSNSNSVEGILDGVTIEINKVTTEPVSINIDKDPTAYQTRVTDVLSEVNNLIQALNNQNDSFSRNLVSRIKTTLSSIPGEFGNDTFTSLINVGLETELDSDGRFVGYTLDSADFTEAFDSAPDELNKLLWGNDDLDSDIGLLNSGNQGVFARLNEILESYTNASSGIIKQVRDSISTQIRTQDDRIFRAEESIENLRSRLTRQFSQLDLINAEAQRQQSALASSGLV